ncbi:MAG: hypothetical protein AAGH15_23800, partial [Myxococcota bacterium]
RDLGPDDASTDSAELRDAEASDLGTAEPGRRLAAIDARVVARAPDVATALAGPGVPASDDGLLGRNRAWGALFSARFQLGAGLALRLALAFDRTDVAARAFRAIEVGALSVEEDGRLPSRVPEELAMGRQPTRADVASGAAFFLSDACPALLVLEAHPSRDLVAAEPRREAVSDALGRTLPWLLGEAEVLVAADGRTPNRLLHDAVAYAACAAIRPEEGALAAATRFTDLATERYDARGFYVEAGGPDTNYQAVNVYVAADRLALSPASPTLGTQLEAALAWMVSRTSADGRVDSTGNARSCEGCEVFLPGDPPKQLGVAAWARALAYGGATAMDDDAFAALERFAAWVETATDTSCFVRDEGDMLVPFDPASCE